MATTEIITVRGDNLTVDLILWRRFKKVEAGLVERIYALNPGLSASGPFLAVGAQVVVPIDAPQSGAPTQTAVRLWD